MKQFFSKAKSGLTMSTKNANGQEEPANSPKVFSKMLQNSTQARQTSHQNINQQANSLSQGQESDSGQEGADHQNRNLLPHFEPERANTVQSQYDHFNLTQIPQRNERAVVNKYSSLIRNTEMSNYSSDVKYSSTTHHDRGKSTLQPAKSTMIGKFDRFKSQAHYAGISANNTLYPKASNQSQNPYQAAAPMQQTFQHARSKSIMALKSQNAFNFRKRSQYKSPYKMK